MKKFILSTAVMGAALMGQDAAAQNRDLVGDAVKAANADLAKAEQDAIKLLQDLMNYEEPEEDELDDSISRHIGVKSNAKPPLSPKPMKPADAKKYDQTLDDLDRRVDKIVADSAQLMGTKQSCSMAEKKQRDTLGNAINQFDQEPTVTLPLVTERKRDKIRRKAREALDATKALCGMK